MDKDLERLIKGLFAGYRLIKKLRKNKKVVSLLEAVRSTDSYKALQVVPKADENVRYWEPIPPLTRRMIRED